MKRYSLYTFVLGIFAVLIAVSLVLIYFLSTQHKNDMIESAIEEKTHLAEVVDKTVASPIWSYHEGIAIPGFELAIMRELKKFEDVIFLRVILKNGIISQSSDEFEIGKPINQCVEDVGICGEDYIPTINKVLYTYVAEIKDETYQGEKVKTLIYPGSENKIIWITFSLTTINEMINIALFRDIVAILLVLVLAMGAIFFILRRIISPIKDITVACQEIRKGNLDAKIDIKSKTELGIMANTFNEMIKDLKKSYTELEEAKNVLKIKVDARTRELREVNVSLEEKVQERTKELQNKIEEQERLIKLTIGRELKMVELKKEIKKTNNDPEKKK
ncbi:HAMP domain-containing protein [Patescibacteria group bacterium]